MTEHELLGAVEFIPDKLYFVSLRSHPRDTPSMHFFTVDDVLVYEPFFADFGPLNLGKTYRFCRMLQSKLKDPENQNRRIYFFSSHDGHKRANAAYLMGAFAVLRLGKSGDEAYRPFVGIYPPFIPFRDASYGISTFNLTILDVLRGLAKGRDLGFIDFDHFNLEEYEFYEQVENGDLNWIIPGKFVAFSGPAASHSDTVEGIRLHTPEDYIPLFKKWGVTLVVRLNKKVYDRRRFTDAGIKHVELYFVDGGVPSDAIVRKFLEITEAEKGVTAVHCKAGLGRTGTLIGCYAIKHYGFTAAEFTGYIRVCRPGSVIGPQQHFLKDVEARLWKQGELFRKRLVGPMADPLSSQLGALKITDLDDTSSQGQQTRRVGSAGSQQAAPRISGDLAGIDAPPTPTSLMGGGGGGGMPNSGRRSISAYRGSTAASSTGFDQSLPATTQTGFSRALPSRGHLGTPVAMMGQGSPSSYTPPLAQSMPVSGGAPDAPGTSINKSVFTNRSPVGRLSRPMNTSASVSVPAPTPAFYGVASSTSYSADRRPSAGVSRLGTASSQAPSGYDRSRVPARTGVATRQYY